MGLALDATDDHQGLAKVTLGVARRMGQRHEHLPYLAAILSDVVLDRGVSAVEPVFVPETLEDALGSVALLPGTPEIVLHDPVDDAGEGLQFGAPGRSLPPVARRDGVGQHLPYSVPVQPERPGRPPGCSNPPPSPPCAPADTIPLCTFLAPSIGSKMTLWMAEGGLIFNRRLSVGQSAHPVQFTSADYSLWSPVKFTFIPTPNFDADPKLSSLKPYFPDPVGTARIAYSGYIPSRDQPRLTYTPIGAFMVRLYNVLAWENASIRTLAEYFKLSGIGGNGEGVFRHWPMAIYSDELKVDIFKGKASGPLQLWDEWNFAFNS